MNFDIRAACENAYAVGRSIDLSGCCYGESHGGGDFVNTPGDYYYFLAGLVNSLDLKRIVELGTHFGGATMAMSRGLRNQDDPENLLVTVDLTWKNEAGFKAYPHIRRVRGDTLKNAVLKQVTLPFHGPIDLLFVDTIHEYRQTYRNIALYNNALKPRWIVLDDIHLNPSMERLWSDLRQRLGDRTFDATELCKRDNAGFGVIHLDPALPWPDRFGAWQLVWTTRRILSGLLPSSVKEFLRR